MSERHDPALELDGVTVWVPSAAGRAELLRSISWRVDSGQHWVVLGPNGAGKTTLLAVAAGRRHPSAGRAAVLGRRLGKTDVRELWGKVGVVDSGLAAAFAPRLSVEDVVLTGATGTAAPLRDHLSVRERGRAGRLLELTGAGGLDNRPFAKCSLGERQRVLIARALMPEPALLLLDEPATGLDLPAREALLTAIDELATESAGLATVTVTHHVEEIPATATHALLLAHGAVVAAGEIGTALSADTLTRCFAVPIDLALHDGRYAARALPRAVAASEPDASFGALVGE